MMKCRCLSPSFEGSLTFSPIQITASSVSKILNETHGETLWRIWQIPIKKTENAAQGSNVMRDLCFEPTLPLYDASVLTLLSMMVEFGDVGGNKKGGPLNTYAS